MGSLEEPGWQTGCYLGFFQLIVLIHEMDVLDHQNGRGMEPQLGRHLVCPIAFLLWPNQELRLEALASSTQANPALARGVFWMRKFVSSFKKMAKFFVPNVKRHS